MSPAAAAALVGLVATPGPVVSPASGPPVAAVAPPTPLGDASGDWISTAVAARLPHELRDLGVPVSSRHELAAAVEGRGVPFGDLAHASMLRVARPLGLRQLVVGSQEVGAGGVRLRLRVVNVATGDAGPVRVVGGSLDALPVILRRMATALAEDLGAPGNAPAEDPAASLAAIRRHAEALREPDAERRLETLASAVAAEPGDDVARLDLGRAQLAARDVDAVLATLHGPGIGETSRREDRFLEARALLQGARHAEAAAVFAELARERGSPGVLTNQALALLRDRRRGSASALARRAVEMVPEDTDAAFNLGWALLVEQHPDEAAFWLEGVVARSPDDVTARLVLAWALEAAGRTAEAEAGWEEVADAVQEFDSPARPDLARRYGRPFDAEWPLAVAEEGRSDAELAAVHVGRAERLLAGDDAEAAVRQLVRAVYLDPYGPRAHRLLARARLSLGATEAALNELRMSLWGRDDPAVRAELATLLGELGRFDEARAEAARVIESDPDNAPALRLLEGAP